jgi:hypothetical protein
MGDMLGRNGNSRHQRMKKHSPAALQVDRTLFFGASRTHTSLPIRAPIARVRVMSGKSPVSRRAFRRLGPRVAVGGCFRTPSVRLFTPTGMALIAVRRTDQRARTSGPRREPETGLGTDTGSAERPSTFRSVYEVSRGATMEPVTTSTHRFQTPPTPPGAPGRAHRGERQPRPEDHCVPAAVRSYRR